MSDLPRPPAGSVDVVVIGAGMGGLSAALALAARGLSVVVVEALPAAGGKLGRALLECGVEVDTGPSVITLPHVLDEVFARAGRRCADELQLRPLDLATRYRFADGCVFDTFGDVDKTLSEVERVLGSAAAGELSAFLRYSERIWREAAPLFVLSPARGPLALLGLGLRSPLRVVAVDPLRSMKASVYSRVKEPHLRDVLLRFATYVGSDARVCPAPLNSIAWIELGLGVYGVHGGVYEIARALERSGRALSIDYRYRQRVRRILVADGRARGVELCGGGRVLASAVVANADVRHVLSELLPSERRDKLPSPSMSAWTGVVRARRVRERPPHEVLFPPRYEDEWVAVFDEQRSPSEPTVYLCAQEQAHGRRGWQEHEPLFVMANAPAGMPDDEGALGVRALARLREAGLLQPDDELAWQRQPSDLAAAFPDTLGALYGSASSTRSAAFFRPPNRAPFLEGLYLASGSAHPGGGVPLCLASGLFAADAVLEDLSARRTVA